MFEDVQKVGQVQLTIVLALHKVSNDKLVYLGEEFLTSLQLDSLILA